jgi:hypothetical protein
MNSFLRRAKVSRILSFTKKMKEDYSPSPGIRSDPENPVFGKLNPSF